MRKVNPYKSSKYAMASLDNGGRFYNFLTRANDGEISSAELAKAAGVLSGKQTMMVYLELSMADLNDRDKASVYAHLSGDLRASYERYKPSWLTVAEAKKNGTVGSSAIITGIPKLIDSKTEFTGFIMIPISTGKTTTFTMIPIIDQYDVYELRDTATNQDYFVAHARGRKKLTERPTRCGGIIKELKGKKEEKKGSNAFLEMVYYSDC